MYNFILTKINTILQCVGQRLVIIFILHKINSRSAKQIIKQVLHCRVHRLYITQKQVVDL